MFINAGIPRLVTTFGFDERFTHGDYGIWESKRRLTSSPNSRAPSGRMEQWRCVVNGKALRYSAVVVMPMAFSACSWFTDFRDQPAIQPWDSVADTIAPRGSR